MSIKQIAAATLCAIWFLGLVGIIGDFGEPQKAWIVGWSHIFLTASMFLLTVISVWKK